MYPVGPELDLVLRRVRGEGGFAHDEAFCLSLLSSFQRIVNLNRRAVLVDATFDMIPEKVIYALKDILPKAGDIVDVRVDDRRLTRIPHYSWLGLTYGYSWFRTVAEKPSSYCLIGRTHLVVRPGVEEAVTVSVRYVKLLDDFFDRDSEVELAPDTFRDALGLLQIALLIRQRNLAEAADRLKEMFDDKS